MRSYVSLMISRSWSRVPSSLRVCVRSREPDSFNARFERDALLPTVTSERIVASSPAKGAGNTQRDNLQLLHGRTPSIRESPAPRCATFPPVPTPGSPWCRIRARRAGAWLPAFASPTRRKIPAIPPSDLTSRSTARIRSRAPRGSTLPLRPFAFATPRPDRRRRTVAAASGRMQSGRQGIAGDPAMCAATGSRPRHRLERTPAPRLAVPSAARTLP